MMAAKIKLALHVPTNNIIHIDIAENGKACNCKCLKCEAQLIARQGDINDSHFSHGDNSNCTGAQESALHRLGKQILCENKQIVIPDHGPISYSSPEPEKQFGSIRPDISALHKEQKIYFEIAVTHFIEEDKKQFIINGKHKCVEIDLGSSYGLPHDKIIDLVLFKTSNKKNYGWESNRGWLVALFIAIGTFLLFVSGSKKRRYR